MPTYCESYIKEFHPISVEYEPCKSTITITWNRFERYVYRPMNGHDILVNQFKVGEAQPSFYIESERYGGASKEELIGRISYDLHDHDSRNWTPNATKMADFVSDSGLEMEHFTLEAEEAVGTLYVMDEELWWDASIYNADCAPQRTSDPCSCCMEALPDDVSKRLGMKCGHVFHKDCLASWIWTKESCPNCRSGFARE